MGDPIFVGWIRVHWIRFARLGGVNAVGGMVLLTSTLRKRMMSDPL
jgi:hypothetical protein